MRVIFSVVGVLLVAACAPTVPDSGAGVGFGNAADYAGRRDAELAGEVTVRPPEQTAADAPAGDNPPAADTGARVVVGTNNPGISDEQDFQAVKSRESIASDAERLQAQREDYQVIAPTALPTRDTSGPNIVEYAISTSNRVGEKVYSRTNPLRNSTSARKCARYISGDLAQMAFLKAGGPARDRLNLDPDGDGFACDWDPGPFRLAVNH